MSRPTAMPLCRVIASRGFVAAVLSTCVFSVLGCLVGCHDGPLYALKHANPYFTMRQWAADEKIGVTDHTRREELLSLAKTMPSLPPERQQYWSQHLTQIFTHDENAEMRRLSVLAAGKSKAPDVLPLIEQALDDESVKVRMEACRALGNRPDEDAARLLASVLGKTQDQDVKHAAIAAIGNHQNSIAADSLKLALQDRDPATQALVIDSLRRHTGKNYGTDPQTWIAALDGQQVEEQPSGGLRSLF